MNELTKPLTSTEIDDLAFLLTKLFTLQDRPANKNKILIYVEEISNYNFPFAAISSGIKSLFNEELKSIKLPTILDAIRDKLILEKEELANCDYCGNTGLITMYNEKKYQFVFACKCDRGKRYIDNMKIAKWKGGNIQYLKNKKYELHDTIKLFIKGD